MQLVYDAVYSRFSRLSSDSTTFLEKLVVLHLAYAELEPQLQQFQQVVSLSPKIVSSVFKKLKEDSDFKNEISVSTCNIFIINYVTKIYKFNISNDFAGTKIMYCIITISSTTILNY